MLTVVKNQIKVSFYSFKYSLMREMINKTTFLSNIIFMILNDATLIIQWLVLFSLVDEVGGYGMREVLIMWGFTANIYGISRLFFKSAYNLSSTINTGKLDAYLVQPKNVLISYITSSVSVSAIGDIIFGYIMLFLFGFSFSNLLIFSLLSIVGATIDVSISIIYGSLAFWLSRSDRVASTANDMIIYFSNYPEGIFSNFIKVILYSIIPVGIMIYMPVRIIAQGKTLLIIFSLISAVLFCWLANKIFQRGLRRYSSSSLMISRI